MSNEKSLITLYETLKSLDAEINVGLEDINQKIDWLQKNPKFSELNDKVLNMYRINIEIYKDVLKNINTLHVRLIKEVVGIPIIK